MPNTSQLSDPYEIAPLIDEGNPVTSMSHGYQLGATLR